MARRALTWNRIDTRRPAAAPPPREASPEASNVRRLRRWKRNPVMIPAELHTLAAMQRVLIRDISRHGAGLVGAHAFDRDEPVTLVIGNGRRFAARLRWRIGMRAGLAFDQPLPDGDSLLDGIVEPIIAAETGRQNAIETRIRSGAGRTWLAAIRSLVGRPGDDRMIARACRKQGFAWLTEADDND